MPRFEFDTDEFMNGIKDKYNAGIDYVKDKYDAGVDLAKDKYDTVADYAKDKYDTVADYGKDKYDAAVEYGKDKYNAGVDVISSKLNDTKFPEKDAGIFANMKDKIIQLTPEYVKTHPWAAGLGSAAALGVLLLAYAAWKRKNRPTKLVEEMCVLYPLMDEYAESLSESYNFDNYNSYVELSERLETVGPMVLDMMLSEDEDFDPNDAEPVETNMIQQILDWFRETGNTAIEKFLDGYNITMEWVKEHQGMAGAAALAAILGTYGVYKLISLYKESRENGDVDKDKLAESLYMLSDFMTVCEAYDPNMSEAQKYKNLTLLCNIIDSDL